MAEVQSRIQIVQDDNLDANPICEHGPMLKFSRETNKFSGVDKTTRIEYFGCSACRNPKECSGLMSNNKASEKANLDKHLMSYSHFKQSSSIYCSTCDTLSNQPQMHSKCLVNPVTEEGLGHPTRILQPNSRDKTEAQYFFSDEAVATITRILKDLKCTKTICLGTPRLHENIKKLPGFKSILLDFDNRLRHFYSPDEFLRYNMFNHYFFCGDYSKDVFRKFLKNDFKRDKVFLLVDPPFGCRTEALTMTVKSIQAEYMALNGMDIMPVIWVFPYFMERYVLNAMPEMTMLDYKVSYTNHKTYNDKGRFGSPVRLFTNILPKLVKFECGFKYCSPCQMYTRIENVHCVRCKSCPSKNGALYKHCNSCATCVKPYYAHCPRCNRCTQTEDHQCTEYQKNAFCWICDEKGHVENNCPLVLRKKAGPMKCNGKAHRICVICRKPNHNEKQCRQREMLQMKIHK